MRKGGSGKSSARARVAGSVVALLVVVALAIGACGGFLAARSMLPPSVVSSTQAGRMQPTQSQYDDSRNVTVTLSSSQGQTVTSPTGGVVTSVTCAAGAQANSGGTFLSLDSVPQLALHTDVPLWRSLTSGTRGEDAQGLNNALRRLGYAAPAGDTMTWATITAYNQLVANVGAAKLTAEGGWAITPASFIWLERDSATIESCTVRQGQQLTPGATVLTTRAAPVAATLTLPTDDLQPGDRALAVGDQRFDVAAGTTQITDAGMLQAIMASQEYQIAVLQAQGGASGGSGGAGGSGVGGGGAPSAAAISVKFPWALKTPVEVWELPPSALYDAKGTEACVLSDGKPTGVGIVASELGKTKVTVDGGGVLGMVRVNAGDDSGACR